MFTERSPAAAPAAYRIDPLTKYTPATGTVKRDAPLYVMPSTKPIASKITFWDALFPIDSDDPLTLAEMSPLATFSLSSS